MRTTLQQLRECVDLRLHPSIFQQLCDHCQFDQFGVQTSFFQHFIVQIPNVGGFHVSLVDLLQGTVRWPEAAYTSEVDRGPIYHAIEQEREYQRSKYGKDKEQSLPGYLVLIENELLEAKQGWAKDLKGRHSPLSEICQIAALCVAAMERYGVTGNAITTNDIPE